ncbi:MAG: hypothetical protein K1W28_02525 [Lachnospiraceae bacterium]
MNKESAKASVTPKEYGRLPLCSAQDMTGLIPAGPVGEEEMEDYEELYPFLPKVPEKDTAKAVKDEP